MMIQWQFLFFFYGENAIQIHKILNNTDQVHTNQV